jgi:CheY-like chemotaxis protein
MVGKVCRLPYLQSKSLRILLVEDQEINCIVASELLTEAGFTHDIVHDGMAAVDAVQNGDYQLVLMDCQMPGMDGMEATRRIRAQERQHPARARVPIIALTANTSGADRDACVASGMDGFCSKPFTTQQLYDAIGAAVGDQPPMPETKHEEIKPRSDTKIAEAPAAADINDDQKSKIENAPAPFDLQTVLQRCSNKPALATMILDKFQSQATEALARIKTHLAENNALELARASHAVKGTAGLLGAAPLQSAAARLEEIGRHQSLGDAQTALTAMQAEMAKCIEHIRTVKAHLNADAARGA